MAQPAKSNGRRTRVLLALAAVAAAAVSPIAGSVAEARDGNGRGRGNERREQSWDRGGRGGEGRGDRRWEAREPPGQRDRGERRGPPGQARRYEDRREDDRRGPPRAYGPPPGVYVAPPRGLRPGGYVPPGVRGAPVYDYDRYRLRPPPQGYGWVRMGNAFVLMSRDGQIFDVIPD